METQTNQNARIGLLFTLILIAGTTIPLLAPSDAAADPKPKPSPSPTSPPPPAAETKLQTFAPFTDPRIIQCGASGCYFPMPTTEFTAHLTDQYGKGIADKSIFFINANSQTSFCSASTNADGWARCRTYVSVVEPFIARFYGDSGYLPSEDAWPDS